MAVYVYSGASGANNGTSWTDAYTSIASAIAGGIATGGICYVHYTHQEDFATDQSLSFTYPRATLICVDKDNSDAYTPMGSSGYIGHASSNKQVAITGVQTSIWGLTIKMSGSISDDVILGYADNSEMFFYDCVVDFTNLNVSGADMIFQANNGTITSKWFVNCEFIIGSNNNFIVGGGHTRMIDCTVTGNPSICFEYQGGGSATGGLLEVIGCDLSGCTNDLFYYDGANDYGCFTVRFHQCKLGSGVTLYNDSASSNYIMAPEVTFTDCNVGDTHMTFAYYSGLGSVVSDTGITFDSSTADYSWKMTTDAIVGITRPLRTPWMAMYNTDTSTSITPYIEMIRDGSSTAYQDDELYGQFIAKVSSGYTLGTLYEDKTSTPNGTPSNQSNGAGTGSWTGEGGTAWSGKVDAGSSLTPAEIGEVMGRVCFSVPSSTIYINPEILV